MDANLKEKWVAALRSGDYEQCQSRFEFNGGFCCLGVLCKVAGKPTLSEGLLGNWDFAIEAIQDGKQLERLYLMNDRGVPFVNIADYIEGSSI